MSRVNAGYTITDSVTVGSNEFVIGEHPTAPEKYVCWCCKDGNNYYWGRYTNDRNEALQTLCERVQNEISLSERAAGQRKRDTGAR